MDAELAIIKLGANQKQILCYNVLGFEQGIIKEGFTKLKDVYDALYKIEIKPFYNK